MSDLERDLYHSLADLVTKTELELADQDEMRRRDNMPARKCSCHSLNAGPGCKPCLVKRGRKVMAEYEAKDQAARHLCNCGLPLEDHQDAESFEPPCSSCGSKGMDVAVQFTFDGWTAQCRACLDAARERETAVAS